MPWDEAPGSLLDGIGFDRLGLAAPLLSATGWIDGLARLVAVDTTLPPGDGYAPFQDALRDMFTPLGFGLRSVEVPAALWREAGLHGPRINVVATRPTGRPTCCIHFHMDTGPVGSGWTRPPLSLTRQGSRLYGRGTTRMKGAIAAVWAALRAADAVGLKLRFDPLLVFTTDAGGRRYPGLRFLSEQGLLEGHLLSLDGWAAPWIWAGALGSLDLRLRIAATGTSHVTADAARLVLDQLMRLGDRIGQRSSAIPATAEAGGGMLRPDLSVTSVSADALEGGTASSCTIHLRRRFTAEEGFEGALAELRDGLAAWTAPMDGVSAEIALVGHLEPVSEPDLGEHGQRWRQALGWGFGCRPGSFRRMGGDGETPLGFAQQAGIREILRSGLQRRGRGGAGPDEFTTIEDVEALGRSVLAYLADRPEIPAE